MKTLKLILCVVSLLSSGVLFGMKVNTKYLHSVINGSNKKVRVELKMPELPRLFETYDQPPAIPSVPVLIAEIAPWGMHSFAIPYEIETSHGQHTQILVTVGSAEPRDLPWEDIKHIDFNIRIDPSDRIRVQSAAVGKSYEEK